MQSGFTDFLRGFLVQAHGVGMRVPCYIRGDGSLKTPLTQLLKTGRAKRGVIQRCGSLANHRILVRPFETVRVRTLLPSLVVPPVIRFVITGIITNSALTQALKKQVLLLRLS